MPVVKFFLLMLFIIPSLAEAKKAATVQEMTASVSNKGNKTSSWLAYGAYGLYGQEVSNDDFQLNSRSMEAYTLGLMAGLKASIFKLSYNFEYTADKQLNDSVRYAFTDLSGNSSSSGVRLDIGLSQNNSLGFLYYLFSDYKLSNPFQNVSEINLDSSKTSYSIQLNYKVYQSLGLILSYSSINYIINETQSSLVNNKLNNNRLSIGISYFN